MQRADNVNNNVPIRPGNAFAISLRWGWFAAIAGVVFGLLLVVVLLDDLDTFEGGARRAGSPLAHSQLPPQSVSGVEIPSRDRVASIFGSQQAVASAPLSRLVAAALGAELTDTSSSIPPQSKERLALHDLNDTSHASIFEINSTSIGSLVVHTHARRSDDLTDPFRGIVEVWARNSSRLFQARLPWESRNPHVLDDDWINLVKFTVNEGHIERFATDIPRRLVALAVKTSSSSQRILYLIQIGSDWCNPVTRVVRQLDKSGPITAIGFSPTHVLYSVTDDRSLFCSVGIDEFSDGPVTLGPAVQPKGLATHVSALIGVPSEGSDKIIVIQWLANRRHQQYTVNSFQLSENIWKLDQALTKKPFATSDTIVNYPDIQSPSNFVLGISPNVVGVSSTPFVMTIDSSLNSYPIKIINLEPKLQFTQLAIDPSGILMALADNSNSIVFLERSADMTSSVQWEVKMELSVPQWFGDLDIMSVGLFRNASHVVVLLTNGVIVSFDLPSQQIGDFSMLFDFHWEIIIGAISLIMYVVLTRIGRGEQRAVANAEVNILHRGRRPDLVAPVLVSEETAPQPPSPEVPPPIQPSITD